VKKRLFALLAVPYFVFDCALRLPGILFLVATLLVPERLQRRAAGAFLLKMNRRSSSDVKMNLQSRKPGIKLDVEVNTHAVTQLLYA